jgi:hypothetical protein
MKISEEGAQAGVCDNEYFELFNLRNAFTALDRLDFAMVLVRDGT